MVLRGIDGSELARLVSAEPVWLGPDALAMPWHINYLLKRSRVAYGKRVSLSARKIRANAISAARFAIAQYS
jgi:hypothetical protein